MRSKHAVYDRKNATSHISGRARDDLVVTASRTDVITTHITMTADDFTVTPENYTNLKITVVPGFVVIIPCEVTLTSENGNKTYDGTPLTEPAVTVGGDGFVDNEVSDIKATGSVTNVSDGDVTNTITWTEGQNFQEDNYNITSILGTLTVTAAQAEVKADDSGKVYREYDPELTATVTGTMNGEKLNYTPSREDGDGVSGFLQIKNSENISGFATYIRFPLSLGELGCATGRIEAVLSKKREKILRKGLIYKALCHFCAFPFP